MGPQLLNNYIYKHNRICNVLRAIPFYMMTKEVSGSEEIKGAQNPSNSSTDKLSSHGKALDNVRKN
jgi:hypothetical protein